MTLSITEDIETDVVVVGFGAAGGSAAITAYEAGAETLIVDKMPEPGGNSLVSSAMMIYPVAESDVAKLTAYLIDVCHGVTEPALIEAFVAGLMENEAWLAARGGELEVFDYKSADPSYSYYIPDKTFYRLPSAQGLNLALKHLKQTDRFPQPTGGHRVWCLLAAEVERLGIPVLTSTPVTEILRSDAGEVVGVRAESDGRELTIHARRGVVLTCGGFEYNDALKWDNLRPQPIHCLGNPSNTGDGIALVEAAGAALWHMTALASTLGFKPADWDAGFALTLRDPGFLYVDQRGERFVDETRLEAHNASVATEAFDLGDFTYPRLPAFLIMNERNGAGKPLGMNIFSYNVVVKGYEWSADNSVELAAGWIQRSDSIGALSAQLGIPEAALQRTLADYNAACARGVDPDFGRSADTLTPIEAPYYTMTVQPLLYNTQGGPRRDEQARVLGPLGQPIPRLFAAGEFGSIWGFRYQTSTNFSEALVYGRIAGRNCAAAGAVVDVAEPAAAEVR